MMRSLYTAISGLTNHQTKMDVIGNNIANINTTGYKSNRASFADTLSQTISGATAATDNVGGTNPQQVGLGMAVSSIDTDFTAGSPTSTGKNTDLAISSDNGLFIVKNGDATYYTRNGNFTLDGSGNLVMNGNGYKVQGWTATDGVLNTSGEPQDLKIDMNSTMAPETTTYVNFGGNVSADDTSHTIQSMQVTLDDGTTQTVPSTDTTAYSVGDPFTYTDSTGASVSANITGITLTMDDGNGKTMSTSGIAGGSSFDSSNASVTGYALGNTAYPGYTSVATVYDSLGAAHAIPVSFQRTPDTAATPADENQWLMSVPAGTYDGVTIPADVTQTLTFDGTTGKLTGGNSVGVTLTTPYPNGAAQSTQVTLNFNDMTQFAGETSTKTIDRDGYGPGVYKDMTIGSDGIITLTYSNGQKQAAGQIAVSNFNNPGGLEKQGGSLYAVSNNSGDPQVGTVAQNGIKITPGALEMSNVNTAREFSEMITTQRGFQANSKIITVSDEMLETLVNMKR